jgi:hypothetical protein
MPITDLFDLFREATDQIVRRRAHLHHSRELRRVLAVGGSPEDCAMADAALLALESELRRWEAIRNGIYRALAR